MSDGRKRFGMLCLLAIMAAPAAYAQAIHIAATVNDAIITTTDRDERRALIITSGNMPNTIEVQQKLNPRVLETLIRETLQLQEAKRLSIEVSDAEIAAALPKIDASRGQKEGSLKRFLETHPQLKRTTEAQLRAELSWSKVIERKIKRSINIAQDEIARAQAAEAATPGITEVQIAAISIPIRHEKEEERTAQFAKELSDQLNQGADFITLARQVATSGKAELNPPVWVIEPELEPAIQQALRTLQPKQITQPLRSKNTYQLIHLLDRRTKKPQAETTEVRLKQISIPLPKNTNADYDAARATVDALRKKPGSCDAAPTEKLPGKATATIARVTYAHMSPQLRDTVTRLNIGEVSDPILTEKDIKLVLLCERTDTPIPLPPADVVKQRLFAEKLELEAEKYLRNLRRDAYIDIKTGG